MREALEVRRKFDEALINEIFNFNLDWDHIWMHYKWEEIQQVITEEISHVLDNFGVTKEGLHYALEIERKLREKYPFDNTKETNLDRLYEKKKLVEKEIKFWENVKQ